MLLAQQRVEHLRHKVVDVKQLQTDRGVGDRRLLAMRDLMAERGHRAVVVRAAPLAVDVREAVDQRGRAGALRVRAKGALPRELALAVLAAGETPLEGRLGGGGQHHGAAVAALLAQAQKLLDERGVPFRELRRILGPVHPREIEDEVGLRAPSLEVGGGRILVALEHLERQKRLIALPSVLPVADGFQGCAQVAPHEPPRAGHENPHSPSPPLSPPSKALFT